MIKKNFRSGQKDYGVQFRPGEAARLVGGKRDFDSRRRNAEQYGFQRRSGQRPDFDPARRIDFYSAHLFQRDAREPERSFNDQTRSRSFPNRTRQDGPGFQVQDFCAGDCGQGQKAGDGNQSAEQSHSVAAPGSLRPESKKI
jgi:hypothetical protein